MAAFHTCLTVGPIRLFISFFYHHKELHGPLDSAIWYRELSAMDLSARIFRPGFFGLDYSAMDFSANLFYALESAFSLELHFEGAPQG